MKLNILFYLCDTKGFLQVMNFVKLGLNIIRFIVPIGLLVKTTWDVYKQVINPQEKDGINKIKNRAIAAVIVFLVPTVIDLVLVFIGSINVNENSLDYTASRCYTNANSSCIQKIDDYLNCEDVDESEKNDCKVFRNCNDYVLTDSCLLKTEILDSCEKYNSEWKYQQFATDNFNFKKE